MIAPPAGAAEPFALAVLDDALDDLMSTRLDCLTGPELLDLMRGVERFRRRLASLDHLLVASVDERRVAADMAERNTRTLLTAVLRISPGESTARLKAAREMGPRTDFGGGALSPLYPEVAAAQAAGTISIQHANVITSAVHSLPLAKRAEHGDELETFLVATAATNAPDHLARAAVQAISTIDPDGTLASEADHRRLRGLTITGNPDGSASVRGRLTPECTATVRSVLDPLAKPASADGDVADARSGAERTHDALLELAKRLLRSGTLPESGGVPATVLVTMTLTQLETRIGVATTTHGGQISVAAALRMAADAEVLPVVLGDGGGVLAYGRAKRHATRHQRRALAARDGGCSFPGCDAPPGWAETHHIRHWLSGGNTDLDNLTLVCGYHHREHERMGWECQLIDGVPNWLPPWIVDPDRIPRRNTRHHVERFVLSSAA